MASRLTRTSLVQARGLAAQAAAKKKDGGSGGIQTSKLSNGLTVTSLDTGNPISSVGLIVKAGTRNETAQNRGLTHALRIAACYATKNNTAFSIVRNLQQQGGDLSVTTSREYTLYSSQLPRINVNEALEYFLATAESPAFKSWEISDNVPGQMNFDLDKVCKPTKAIELLHQAAFRDGLGNSIYSPAHMVGKHKPAMLQEFHEKHYLADRMVLLGLDVDHDALVRHGETLNLGKGAGPANTASKFHSGELRHDTTGYEAYVAIAAESAPGSNVKEAVANMLLQQILGTAPKVRYSQGQGKLQNAIASQSGAQTVSGLNYTYSDAGLTGAFIASDTCSLGEVVSKVVAALRSVDVTEADLQAAKKAMTIYVNDEMSNAAAKLEAIAAHTALGAKEAVTPAQMEGLFSQATLSDVKAAAKKLSNAKFAVGAAGNLATMPYVDQL